MLQRKKKPYPNLNSYDYSWFAREMTEEELYTVNGGQVMSQADQYAMAQAHTQGDQETMDTIVSKYENKDEQNAGNNSPATGTSSSTSSNSDTSSQQSEENTAIPMNYDALPRPKTKGTMSPDEQAMMAMYDEMIKTGSGRNMQYGTIAGYVVDKEGALGFGHAGWFVQTYDNKFVFFEITGISKKTNGLKDNIPAGTTAKDYNEKATTVLSNSPVGKVTMPLATSLDFPTQAGCLARVYDSKEEMMASLSDMQFDEMIVFNTNSVQNAYIYDASVEIGKSFYGYELLTNSCGIIGRDVLTTDGSGINSYFDIPVPNMIDNVLSASNNNCWREKL